MLHSNTFPSDEAFPEKPIKVTGKVLWLASRTAVVDRAGTVMVREFEFTDATPSCKAFCE
ncbi:hypothetical protein D3C86_2218810 [compost metagenome]